MFNIKAYRRLNGLLFLFSLLFSGCDTAATFEQYYPQEELLPSSQGTVVRHTWYALDFNTTHRQANWVYYELKDRGAVAAERKNLFKPDPKLKHLSPTKEDYSNCGYDRGHLCPAADMSFNQKAMDETFYMSNMSPQERAFNSGIWSKLEKSVRERAQKEPLFIVTGPIFKENKGKIGSKKNITVPGYYYKILYSPQKQQMIAYILPNKNSNQPLHHFIVPVDSVEQLTGIDFFPQLPDKLEATLEADTAMHIASFPARKGVSTPGQEQQLVAVIIAVVLFAIIVLFIRAGKKNAPKKKKKKRKKRKSP